MQIPGAVPKSSQGTVAVSFTFCFLFAARILWKKTVWTLSRGPQLVGFALWHIHSALAVIGMVSSFVNLRLV